MGEKTDQIERYIEEQRAELGYNIQDIEQRVKDTFDWRAQFEQRPLAMLGLAVGGGLLLSALIGSRPRSRNKSSFDEQRYKPADRQPATSSPGATSESMRAIKGALIAVAATKLGDVLDSFIPGFSEEYNKARRDDGSYRPAHQI